MKTVLGLRLESMKEISSLIYTQSYEKLATLRKEFGHSGSHKSDDGTLYIGNSLLLLDCDGSHRSVYIGKQSSC